MIPQLPLESFTKDKLAILRNDASWGFMKPFVRGVSLFRAGGVVRMFLFYIPECTYVALVKELIEIVIIYSFSPDAFPQLNKII